MVTTTSDGTREVTDYSALTGIEIKRRIVEYEEKYGASLKRYVSSFSCDHSAHEEVF
jgi:hypothetical protein